MDDHIREIPPQEASQLWRPEREGQAHDGFHGRVEAAEPEGRAPVRHGLLAVLAVATRNMLDRLLVACSSDAVANVWNVAGGVVSRILSRVRSQRARRSATRRLSFIASR